MKIKKAFCKPQEVTGNPIFEYVKYVLIPWSGALNVVRSDQHGGNK